MNRKRYTAAVLTAAITLGLSAGLSSHYQDRSGQEKAHAMLFVEINGTPLDLSKERYLEQNEKAFLRNDSGYIVHRHGEDITWTEFLNSVGMELQKPSDCLQLPEKKECGNMTVLLNGEKFNSTAEIDQGDKLAVVIGEGAKETAEAYMAFELPSKYRETSPGTRL